MQAVEDTEYMVTVGGEVCAQARTTLTLSNEQEVHACTDVSRTQAFYCTWYPLLDYVILNLGT